MFRRIGEIFKEIFKNRRLTQQNKEALDGLLKGAKTFGSFEAYDQYQKLKDKLRKNKEDTEASIKEQLKKEIEDLKKRLEQLQKEREELKKRLEQLEKERDESRGERARLEKEREELRKKEEHLGKQQEELRKKEEELLRKTESANIKNSPEGAGDTQNEDGVGQAVQAEISSRTAFNEDGRQSHLSRGAAGLMPVPSSTEDDLDGSGESSEIPRVVTHLSRSRVTQEISPRPFQSELYAAFREAAKALKSYSSPGSSGAGAKVPEVSRDIGGDPRTRKKLSSSDDDSTSMSGGSDFGGGDD